MSFRSNHRDETLQPNRGGPGLVVDGSTDGPGPPRRVRYKGVPASGVLQGGSKPEGSLRHASSSTKLVQVSLCPLRGFYVLERPIPLVVFIRQCVNRLEV